MKQHWRATHMLGIGLMLSLVGVAAADTLTLNFAPVGTSYLAFLGPDDPAVGSRDKTRHKPLQTRKRCYRRPGSR